MIFNYLKKKRSLALALVGLMSLMERAVYLDGKLRGGKQIYKLNKILRVRI